MTEVLEFEGETMEAAQRALEVEIARRGSPRYVTVTREEPEEVLSGDFTRARLVIHIGGTHEDV